MAYSDDNRLVPMRLQKFLARAGVASRRGSEKLMSAGRVTVNGRVVAELGSKVDPRVDEVRVDGAVVTLADEAVVLMLHKPAGVLTTMNDPQGRPCVAPLVPTERYPGLFPVGRLDGDTTGLLLFSTDGELAHALLRPKAHVVKRYLALVEGRPDGRALARLRGGVELCDGTSLPAEARLLPAEEARRSLDVLELPAPPRGRGRSPRAFAEAAVASGEESVVELGLHEGRKREVKRMLNAVGHPVLALHRAAFGPLALGALARGRWRELTDGEVESLRAAAASGSGDARSC